jgi:hypothetical protein
MATTESEVTMQAKRIASAVQQFSDYAFSFAKYGGISAVKVEKRNGEGEPYYVTGDGSRCTCPDASARLAGTEVRCKHQIMAELWREQEFRKSELTFAKRMAQDFPDY